MAGAEFSGNCTHTIDPKGRLTIPAAHRKALGDDFTIGMSNKFKPIRFAGMGRYMEIWDEFQGIGAIRQVLFDRPEE